jgi:hypothetical protein
MKIKNNILLLTVILIIMVSPISTPCFGEEASTEELAKAAQNPVANMISFPLQNNTNFGMGEYDRTQNVLNIQPVYPISGKKWNIITRTIVPIVYQPDVAQTNGGNFGLGDINPTFWLSPAKPGKLIWGVGPTFLLPTATHETLGTGKWGIGPSVVLLVMPGKWTIGILASNIWSIAGKSDRADINQMVIKYFINYNLPRGWYISNAPIITANWKASGGNKWLVQFGIGIGKLHRLGKQPINVTIKVYYNAVHPETLYADWSLRLQLTLLFPKK